MPLPGLLKYRRTYGRTEVHLARRSDRQTVRGYGTQYGTHAKQAHHFPFVMSEASHVITKYCSCSNNRPGATISRVRLRPFQGVNWSTYGRAIIARIQKIGQFLQGKKYLARTTDTGNYGKNTFTVNPPISPGVHFFNPSKMGKSLNYLS